MAPGITTDGHEAAGSGRPGVLWSCIQPVRGTILKSAKRTIEDTQSGTPGAGGCNEAATASAEPGGVEPVCRPGRPVRCPGVHADRTHQADPPVDPYGRAAHGHRPDPAGQRRADPLAAPAGWGGTH